MLSFYLPHCKPFYKLSILTLQLQVGLKCNLVETRGFGLSAIKTNIKDTFSLPESLYELLSTSDETNSVAECSTWPESFEDAEELASWTSFNSSNEAVTTVESIMTGPPSPPQGHVLWQKQPWRNDIDQQTRPEVMEIDGWKFVPVEEVVSPAPQSTSPGRPRCANLPEDLEELVERAWIEEYVYTGNCEKDLRALRSHVKACKVAVKALDPDIEERRTMDRLKLRLDIRVLMESLKEEVELLTEEAHPGGYYGFEDGIEETRHAPRQSVRPEGFRWARPGWL